MTAPTWSLLTRGALVRLTNRKVLQVQGPDAARFLQGIVTNDMKGITGPQTAIYGAFLTTKGRVLGDCNVVQVEEETFFLDYDASVDEELTKHWKRYKLRMKVKLEDKSSDFQTVAAVPAAIAESPNFASLDAATVIDDLAQRNTREASVTGGVVFRDPRGAAFGLRAILPESSKLAVPEAFEQGPLQQYTDRRIFLGAAEGKDLSDSIPLEASLELLRGVSFRKGCYVGQELTARTQFKGNVRKRYVPIALVPSSMADLVQDLSQKPFQRLDAADHQVLREFLATSIPESSTLPENGTSIIKPGSSKAVGSIVTTAQGINSAIAMMRLEHVFPKDEGSDVPPMSFTTADGAFHAIPFEPTWWPAMDHKTGKMVM